MFLILYISFIQEKKYNSVEFTINIQEKKSINFIIISILNSIN